MTKYSMTCVALILSLHGLSQPAVSLKDSIAVDTSNQIKASNISVSSYFKLLKEDFITQAEAPFQLKRNDLLRVTAFGLLTAGVTVIDEQVNHLAVNFDSRSSAVKQVSPVVTKFGGRYDAFVLGSLGAYSYLFKNQRLKTATLLATQSYIISGFWVTCGKFISGRSRPSYYNLQTNENESTWHGFLYQFRRTNTGQKPDGAEFSSFPSGHSAAAFSIATTYALMFKDKPWVGILAYSSASLIGLSRITENKHWASDVLVGSALGYICSKQVVKNYRKHEKTNSLSQKRKHNVSFNINYLHKGIATYLVYKFP